MSERIAVYGCGYLGAVHAAGMAELGHSVVGVDVNAGALTKLQSGVVPFFEPGLEPSCAGTSPPDGYVSPITTRMPRS